VISKQNVYGVTVDRENADITATRLSPLLGQQLNTTSMLPQNTVLDLPLK
jgi:hypothetical protein